MLLSPHSNTVVKGGSEEKVGYGTQENSRFLITDLLCTKQASVQSKNRWASAYQRMCNQGQGLTEREIPDQQRGNTLLLIIRQQSRRYIVHIWSAFPFCPLRLHCAISSIILNDKLKETQVVISFCSFSRFILTDISVYHCNQPTNQLFSNKSFGLQSLLLLNFKH